MKNIQNLTIDINKKPFQTITANVGEVASRFIKITILENNIPADLTGVTAYLYAKKADGTKVFNSAKVENAKQGIVLAELTSQTLAVAGLAKLTLLLTKDGAKLASKQIIVTVDESSVDEEAIQSSNEFNAFTDALRNINNIDNKVWSMANMGQDIKEAMTGGSVAVVGKNSVLNENIVEGQISYNKTNFLTVGKNLFNKDTVSAKGWYMQYTDGRPVSNEYVTSLCYSDFIKVKPSSSIIVNTYTHSYCLYDVNMNFIEGKAPSTSPCIISIPSNCEYVIVNTTYDQRGNTSVEYGTSVTDYESYTLDMKYLKANSDIEKIVEDINQLDNEIENANSSLNNAKTRISDIESFTNLVIPGKNLFNKNTISEQGYYIQYNNGAIVSNEYTTELHYSDFIKIKPSSIITISSTAIHSYCFFDIDKKHIEGATIRGSLLTTQVPSNAEYLVVNPYNAGVKDLQVEYGESATEYEPYCVDIQALKANNDIDNIEVELEGLDAYKSRVDEIVTCKDISINIGTATTPRRASSTFTGWAAPFKKTDLKDDITYVSVYATAYDNGTDGNMITDVPVNLELIKCSDNLTSYDNWKVIKVVAKSILKESGKVEFKLNLPLDELDDVFYLGVRATTKCNLMFWDGKQSQEYSFDGYPVLYSTNSNTFINNYVLSNDTGFAVTEFNIGTGISAKLSDHKHNIEDIEGIEDLALSNKVKLSLPNKYELVVGDTFELFYKGILLCNNPYNYNINISCSKGAYYSKKYMFTPTASDVGTHNMTISVYNDNEQLLDSKTVKLIVKNKASSPSTVKNVLCVGDSLTSGGAWASEVCRRLTGNGGSPSGDGLTNVKFIGSLSGTSGAKYEGYGGWTYDNYNGNNVALQNYWINTNANKGITYQKSVWQDSNGVQWVLETIESNRIKIYRNVYGTQLPPASGTLTWVSGGDGSDNEDIVYTSYVAESGNPFWNDSTSSVDFKNYTTKLGVSNIDYCYVLLGWNQTGNTETQFKDSARTFINNLFASFPNCKITLMGLQVPSLDGFGANYGCSWNYYDKLKVVFNINKWNYELTKEYSNVDFINIAGQFDSENNIITSTRQVNVRNSKTEIYGANGVHPATEGYLQIADAVYRNLSHKI